MSWLPTWNRPFFGELRREMSQVGLFRVYTDTQNTALQLADEAKAYAKAVIGGLKKALKDEW